MLTDFARDHAFTIGWFGLMTLVWLGWGQEDPKPAWRWRLGVGSVLGALLTGVFAYAVVTRWNTPSALAGRQHWFGILVGAEVVAAGLGCLILARTGRSRWMAWWVAVVVAAHFIPLAAIFGDVALVALAVIQGAALAWLLVRLRGGDEVTSRYVGPVMGATLLGYALVSAVIFMIRYGTPWLR